MKTTTLLLSAGLLSALCTLPATASPLAIESALILTQASVNPIFMEYEGIKGSMQALEEAAAMIDTAIADAKRSADPPDPEATASIQKVGTGQLILAGYIGQALDDNSKKTSTGDYQVNGEGFVKSLARLLNNKNPELMRFAAIGWETTVKRATGKITGIASDPSDVNTNDAIIAILIGMLREVEGNTYYVGTANGGVWKTTNAAIDASDLADWRSNYGTGG